MTYETRCILQYMKLLLEIKPKPTRADWLDLAHAIADGRVVIEPHAGPRTVTVSSRMRSVP